MSWELRLVKSQIQHRGRGKIENMVLRRRDEFDKCGENPERSSKQQGERRKKSRGEKRAWAGSEFDYSRGPLPCGRCFYAHAYHIKLRWCPKYQKLLERP